MVAQHLKEVLGAGFSEEELALVVRGYDVVGDVAIIIIPDALVHREKEIGEALLGASKHVRVVAKRVGKYGGEYRRIQLKKICGAGGFETVHKEYGISLSLNPGEVYFSTRSATERFRVAQCVEPGEQVLVMFSGIGPYPLMIAKHRQPKTVIGVEKNPLAHRYGINNVQMNRVSGSVLLIQDDVANFVQRHRGRFHRIIMPLPGQSSDYLAAALEVLHHQGNLHYYHFANVGKFHHGVDYLERECRRLGRPVKESSLQKCGHVAPGKYRVCLDVKLH